MKIRFSAAIAAIVVFSPFAADAQVKLDGYFIAREVCPATQNIRAGDNPGNVTTEIGRAYDLFGKNKEAATHYWIGIDGPEPKRRWVAASCGERVMPVVDPSVVAGGGGVAGGGSGADNGGRPVSDAGGSGATEFVFAISWQPAFCQTHQSKTECANQTGERFDATHFALHGLWPQPRSNVYCGIPQDQERADDNGDWDSLPRLALSEETRARLDIVMPGTQSNLQRHEWTKHGSCFGDGSPETYYRVSVALMEAINASKVRDLFAARIGERVTGAEIRAAFDEAFGVGAGERVKVSCSAGLVGELTIGLGGTLTEDSAIADHIQAAGPTSMGCNGGKVDPVGF